MATFLLEVGTEELPADFVASALEQWRSHIPLSLTEHHLAPESIEVFGTPRRLAALIAGLPDHQPDQSEDIKGPPAQAAYKNGKPTKAAEGFARKQGVDLDALEVRTTDKGDFVFVHKMTQGQPTIALLPELIPQWIFKLEGKRFMRWGDGDLRFQRPIRWLVALWDDQVLPVTLENGLETIHSDRQSQGHRVLRPGLIPIPHAQDYRTTLNKAFVQVDSDQRCQTISDQIQALAHTLGGQAFLPPDLLSEVTHLVEWPTAVAGNFEPEYLQLPPEVITTEMISHQRYFPVRAQAGAKPQGKKGKKQDSRPDGNTHRANSTLLPHFITISNGDPAKSDLIAAGNERVLRARLADGQFFFKADRTQALEGYLPQLETVTFQADLGSMRQKVDRIQQQVERISQQLQLDESTQQVCQRAALLCKADLVTQMVGEFPELQGVMGQKYAIASGESEAVATAIVEHYLPRSAEDALPQTLPGQVVALADRLDTLVSILGLGLLPTGSSDPFALRRAGNAILNVIWAAQLPLNLDRLVQDSAQAFVQATETAQPLADLEAHLHEFWRQRLRSLFQEELEVDYDLINAVLGDEDHDETQRVMQDVLDGRDRAQFLQQIRDDGTLAPIYETVNRAARLAQQGDLETDQLDPKAVVQTDLFQQPSEPAFYDAILKLLPITQAAQANRDYRQLVQGLAEIAPTISQFFDGPDSVLVMAEHPDLRQNRLNLLGLLRNHALVLGDFGAIVKS